VHIGGLLHGAGRNAGVCIHADTWIYLDNLRDWRVPWVRPLHSAIPCVSIHDSIQLWRSTFLCSVKFTEFKQNYFHLSGVPVCHLVWLLLLLIWLYIQSMHLKDNSTMLLHTQWTCLYVLPDLIACSMISLISHPFFPLHSLKIPSPHIYFNQSCSFILLKMWRAHVTLPVLGLC
jgi:hypothetical protein